MLPTLTEREKRVLFFIRLWQYEKRCSPSNGEIAEQFGVEKSTIWAIVKKLKLKGYLEMSESKSWQHKTILFPKGTTMPWGNEQLPDELFDYLKPKNEPDNGKELQNTI